jgi:hypothetical protein
MPHGPQSFRVPTRGTQTPPVQVIKSNPLVLASPEPSETLLLYVATTTQVISAALVVEQEEPGHIYNVHRMV